LYGETKNANTTFCYIILYCCILYYKKFKVTDFGTNYGAFGTNYGIFGTDDGVFSKFTLDSLKATTSDKHHLVYITLLPTKQKA